MISSYFIFLIHYVKICLHPEHLNFTASPCMLKCYVICVSADSVTISRTMGRSSRTVYVGNLPGDIRESEIEDLFYKVRYFCFIHWFLRL